MGWKNVKEHYRIGHLVQVTEKGICIGSAYIHDLIVIGLDGAIKKRSEEFANTDLRQYRNDFTNDPALLKRLIELPDVFAKSITVYTYEGGEVIEKKCEELEWPNVTHDGQMMYENTFSTDKNKVAGWAKRNAKGGIEWRAERKVELLQNVAALEAGISECEANLLKLNADYPNA